MNWRKTYHFLHKLIKIRQGMTFGCKTKPECPCWERAWRTATANVRMLSEGTGLASVAGGSHVCANSVGSFLCLLTPARHRGSFCLSTSASPLWFGCPRNVNVRAPGHHGSQKFISAPADVREVTSPLPLKSTQLRKVSLRLKAELLRASELRWGLRELSRVNLLLTCSPFCFDSHHSEAPGLTKIKERKAI